MGREDEGPEGGREQGPGGRGTGAASWVNWQVALYVFVLLLACVFLVPLTNLWWIVPVLGVLLPLALAFAPGGASPARRRLERKERERELLGALAGQGELTPTTAAMRTSLTVDEASKMLGELARKGHLEPRVEDGVVAYALGRRAGRGSPGGETAPGRLEDPLSERELEVLGLLAQGKTNSEVAGELFVSVGTVKSHTGNIYRKLGAKNRTEAISRARSLNLLP